MVRVRVKGLFPLEDNDVFIPISLIEKSIYTDYTLDNEEIMSIDIGCDVARFGDDKTVISHKVNKKVEIYKSYIGKDLMRTAKEVATLFLKLTEKHKFTGQVPVKIDDGGLGGGVTDKLRELQREDPERFKNMLIVPIIFGKPIKHKYFADTTTFMMNVIKELISSVDEDGNKKEVDVVLPNNSDLVAQLSMRKYEFNSKSKIKVESKDEMKKRIGHSPDEADSILLVCMPVKTKKRKEG